MADFDTANKGPSTQLMLSSIVKRYPLGGLPGYPQMSWMVPHQIKA